MSFRNCFYIFLILTIAGFLAYDYHPLESKAGEAVKGPNDLAFSGYAWSSNIGWISFCGNEDGDGRNCDKTASPDGDHRVYVDNSTGGFRGHAWSSNIGWISFDRSETGNPPMDDAGGGSGPIAIATKTAEGQRIVTGWARALAACDSVPCASSGAGSNTGGWDGWIKFSGSTSDGGSYATEASSSYQLVGWAWGADKIGWVSFGTSSASYENVTAERPQIKVVLTASSSVVGFGPMHVALTAAVTTSSTRPITYDFNCDNAPTSTIVSGDHIASSSCFYVAPGRYWPKVTVTQDGVFDSMSAPAVLTGPDSNSLPVQDLPGGIREVNPNKLPNELPPTFFNN